jgi:hypothetical protein
MVADGFAQEFGRGGEVEFLFHVDAVGLDGFDVNVKEVGNLACSLALSQQLENLPFTVTEGLNSWFYGCVSPGHEMLQQFGGRALRNK